MFQFEQFPVYILAKSFYQNIQPITNNTKIPEHIRDQLDRATTSIILNIAEGAGKYGMKDKRRYYLIARGSANECFSILQILQIKSLLVSAEFKFLEEDLNTISKMLTGLIKRMADRNINHKRKFI